ncbi:MAG: hypothetical protein NXI21_01760 [Alphaproteobacteria bacterium]|nr:hypothetical protein [Alphaproteobacteria bacterium]
MDDRTRGRGGRFEIIDGVRVRVERTRLAGEAAADPLAPDPAPDPAPAGEPPKTRGRGRGKQED